MAPADDEPMMNKGNGNSGHSDPPQEQIDYDRLCLYFEGIRGFGGLSELAEAMIAELGRVGLSSAIPHGSPPKGSDDYPIPNHGSSKPTLRPVELKTGSRIFVQPDARRELLGSPGGNTPEQRTAGKVGYRFAVVLDDHLRTDEAIVAALTVMESRREKLEQATSSPDPGRLKRMAKRRPLRTKPLTFVLAQLGYSQPEFGDSFEQYEVGPPNFAVSLLEHFRPEFGDLDERDKVRLIEKTEGRIEAFSKALDRLLKTLEYEPASGALKVQPRKLNSSVRVAQLHDIAGYTYTEIAELLGARKPTGRDEDKAGHKLMEDHTKQGRRILTEALGGGEAAYRDYCDQKTAEAEAWQAMALSERRRILLAESALLFGAGTITKKAIQYFAARHTPLFEKIIGRIYR